MAQRQSVGLGIERSRVRNLLASSGFPLGKEISRFPPALHPSTLLDQPTLWSTHQHNQRGINQQTINNPWNHQRVLMVPRSAHQQCIVGTHRVAITTKQDLHTVTTELVMILVMTSPDSDQCESSTGYHDDLKWSTTSSAAAASSLPSSAASTVTPSDGDTED